MSFRNDSQNKSGSHPKNANSKSPEARGAHASAAGTRDSKGGKGAQSKASAPRGFQASDIRNLIQNHGKVEVDGQEWALRAPSWNDSALQAIIKDPQFTVKPTGRSSTDGKVTYELRGHGKTINVTISH